MRRRKDRKIAEKRIKELFKEAEEAAASGKMDRADRYVELARKIGMRYNVTLQSEFRRRVCRNCYSYLYPGKSCRVRLQKGKLVTRCDRCGEMNRYIFR